MNRGAHNMSQLARLLVIWLVSGIGATAVAQSQLPAQVGFLQYGYRNYATQTYNYDASGSKSALGSSFDQDFSGRNMLSGHAGSDLKRLATELKKYDGAGENSPLLDQLTLGQLSGDVRADIQAQFIGYGYGISQYLTLYVGVPWLDAKVTTDLHVSGRNNALVIKEQLGDLAFDELKEALTKAAALSPSQIEDSITDLGYDPVDEWNHSGFGDLQIGAKSGKVWNLKGNSNYALGLTGILSLPTGYVDSPDVLTDVSFGKGYASLGFEAEHRLVIQRHFLISARSGYTKSLPGTLEKRVPEAGETLVAEERKTKVKINGGDDSDIGAGIGLTGRWYEASISGGFKRHFSDRYSGSLPGDYGSLAAESDSEQLYQEASFSISTVPAYRNKRFPLPLLVNLKGHAPVKARNSTDERYIELSVGAFLSNR